MSADGAFTRMLSIGVEETIEAIQGSTAAQNVKRAAAGAMIPWPIVAREFGAQLEKVTSIDPVATLLGCWSKYRELRQHADRSKHSADEVALVPMVRHKVKSSQQAKIEVFAGAAALGHLDFQFDLSLELEGVILKVQDGRIRSVTTGRCQGRAALACAGNVLVEKKTQYLELSGVINLGEGIAISTS